jgi:hypothetical protein
MQLDRYSMGKQENIVRTVSTLLDKWEQRHVIMECVFADMKNSLCVSKYQVELPKKEEMERFIEESVREVGR